MGLVVGPSGDRLTGPANILETTRAGDDIDSINGFTPGWSGKREPSARLVGGKDDWSEVNSLAKIAGVLWKPVGDAGLKGE